MKIHSLKERSVFIVDRRVHNNYSLEQLEMLRALKTIRQKQNRDVICFVSFKNKNWEKYCLLIV